MSAAVVERVRDLDPEPDEVCCQSAPHPAGPGSRPAPPRHVDRLIRLLEQTDQIMADAVTLLRASRGTGEAERQSGLPIERLVSLATGRTGTDIRFVSKAERTLTHMPAVDAAFQTGQLSWSQVRGIVSAAKGLRVAQIAQLDSELDSEIGQGEPDRIIQRAFGWADLIVEQDQIDRPEQDPGDRKFFRVQPDLFGGAAYHGYDRLDAVTTILEAAQAAADQPFKPGDVRLDADGNEVPADLLPATGRQAQLAEGLRRACAAYLGNNDEPDDEAHNDPVRSDSSTDRPLPPTQGSDDLHTPGDGSLPIQDGTTDPPSTPPAAPTAPRRHDAPAPARSADPTPRTRPGKRTAGRTRTALTVIIDHTDLLGQTGRALARWHGGPIRLTRLTTGRLACDPQLTAIITDSGRPVAIGDATAPITIRHHRTLTAVDRGCRMPGCSAPPQHCDAHHLIPRDDGGPTSTDNLMLLCRDCHSRLHHHDLTLSLNRHTRAVTLTLTDGRTYTSLPA